MPRVVLGDTETEEMITPRQLGWLRDLVVQKDTGTMDVSKIEADPPVLTKDLASKAITWLLKRPPAQRPLPQAQPVAAKAPSAPKVSPSDLTKESRPTEPGYYVWTAEVVDDVDEAPIYLRAIINVKTGHLNYHLYSNTEHRWHYEKYGKIDNFVKDMGVPDRMSQEEIATYGHRSKHCLCCGYDLSNELSLERGIGPECFAKYGGLGMF